MTAALQLPGVTATSLSAGVVVAAVLGAAVVIAGLVVLMRANPDAFPLLAVLALPFRLPISAEGRTVNLLIPLYLVVAAGVLAQGLVYSVHSGLVLSRADTRNLTRAWLLANVPAGSKIVVEPVAPDGWAREQRTEAAPGSAAYRWHKYPSLLSRISSSGTLLSGGFHIVATENYERTLSPALIGYYRAHGYCEVISGSTQSGRAFADAHAVPLAVAYYRALQRQGEVLFRSSPYASGAGPVAFGFDWSFDYYPLAYRRPGPSMTVYRLHGGRCGP